MLIRTFAALVIVVTTASMACAERNDVPLKVGDLLVLRMSGELGMEYARHTDIRTDLTRATGFCVETCATIDQKLPDGRVRITLSNPIRREGKPDQLVTLDATVEASQIKAEVTPKGTPILAAPNATKPTLTETDATSKRLELSGLKGVKLRTWTIARESGN